MKIEYFTIAPNDVKAKDVINKWMLDKKIIDIKMSTDTIVTTIEDNIIEKKTETGIYLTLLIMYEEVN
ncbi:MAG: hypothetical protein ACI4PE_03395 [Bacilli bacterium]